MDYSSSKTVRKYYELCRDLKKSSSPTFDWPNRKELLKDYWKKPGFFQFDDVPQVRFDRTGNRGPILDAIFNKYIDGWLISDRLKLLFERVDDPQAFAFCKVDILVLIIGLSKWFDYLTVLM